MKKFFCSLLLIVISLIFLSACGSGQIPKGKDLESTKHETVNTIDGVTMYVQDESISSSGLSLLIENNSDKQLIYSEDFLLEKKIEGKWYQVPITPGASFGFDEPGYEVDPSNVSEWTVDWGWLYGRIDTGEYRIVKSVLDFREPGDYEEHYLAAQFSID